VAAANSVVHPAAERRGEMPFIVWLSEGIKQRLAEVEHKFSREWSDSEDSSLLAIGIQ
jgi:hypothetical protein